VIESGERGGGVSRVANLRIEKTCHRGRFRTVPRVTGGTWRIVGTDSPYGKKLWKGADIFAWTGVLQEKIGGVSYRERGVASCKKISCPEGIRTTPTSKKAHGREEGDGTVSRIYSNMAPSRE